MLSLLSAFDLIGTFVFALSGGMVGVRNRLDLFGVLVLSFAAATSGGILRDVLIGSHPPSALADGRYVLVTGVAGLLVFYRHRFVEQLRNPVQLFDGAGLALFAVTGTSKALSSGLDPVAAVLLGTLSGIGGGIARDVLVARTPVVLHSELYAVAAIAGAAMVVLGNWLQWPAPPVLWTGAILTFGLRFMAIRRGWKLPVAPLESTQRDKDPPASQ